MVVTVSLQKKLMMHTRAIPPKQSTVTKTFSATLVTASNYYSDVYYV